MAQESFADLVRELKELGAGIVAGDTKTNARIDVLQKALDVLTIRMNRPGAEGANDNDLERKDAVGLCRIRRSLTTPKIEAGLTDDYSPAASEVDAALMFRKALKIFGDTGTSSAWAQRNANHSPPSRSARPTSFCRRRWRRK